MPAPKVSFIFFCVFFFFFGLSFHSILGSFLPLFERTFLHESRPHVCIFSFGAGMKIHMQAFIPFLFHCRVPFMDSDSLFFDCRALHACGMDSVFDLFHPEDSAHGDVGGGGGGLYVYFWTISNVPRSTVLTAVDELGRGSLLRVRYGSRRLS